MKKPRIGIAAGRMLVFEQLERLAENGQVEMCVGDLSQLTGLSAVQAKRSFQVLVAEGAIKRLRAGHRSGRPTLYQVMGPPTRDPPKGKKRTRKALAPADRPRPFPIAPPPPADVSVRRVAPGTFPARGFSMLGGRL